MQPKGSRQKFSVVNKSVGPANDYQVVQNMSTDNWVGYFSPGRNSWDNGFNQTSYYISNGRANGTFSTLITRIINMRKAVPSGSPGKW